MNELKLIKPDDWHVHVRDGQILATVLPDLARRFARAIIMPNLKPPITTTEAALAYRIRLLSVLPKDLGFEPLMTLYLTDNTTADEIVKAHTCGYIKAVKLYPAGATTNSDSGVTDLEKIYLALEAMEKYGLPLLVHGEVTDPEIDIFDREKIFIDRHLVPLATRFPNLRIVFEHITTREAVEFVKSAGQNIAATITAHHLMFNRNAMLAGGIQPHHYCLPVLKRETHRQALIAAATSGNAKFFLGTDSAPHPKKAKEAACGCAGIYSSLGAIEFYAEIFEHAQALDKLEGFASFYGADFYRLPRNSEIITLKKISWDMPEQIHFNKDVIVPLRAGGSVAWRIEE